MTNAEATTTTEAAPAAEQGTHVAPEPASSKKAASKKKVAPKGQKADKKNPKPASKKAAKAPAKPASKKASKAKDAAAPREGSKKQIVLDLMRRKDGATMAEIAKATGWQNHSIRGFISGTVAKKMDLPVASLKNEQGERVYRIEK